MSFKLFSIADELVITNNNHQSFFIKNNTNLLVTLEINGKPSRLNPGALLATCDDIQVVDISEGFSSRKEENYLFIEAKTKISHD